MTFIEERVGPVSKITGFLVPGVFVPVHSVIGGRDSRIRVGAVYQSERLGGVGGAPLGEEPGALARRKNNELFNLPGTGWWGRCCGPRTLRGLGKGARNTV